MITQPQPLGTAQLQFSDIKSCRQWICSLPLTNVRLAQHTLTQQIALARQAGLPPMELLRVLEALHEPVAYVQLELARKYTGKPLPLDANEAALWARAGTLWEELVDAYHACHDARMRGDTSLNRHGALILMRCLRYTSLALFEHYRVYREPPAALWRKLCQFYLHAEQGGFAHVTVIDKFENRDADSNCTAAFCHALLAQIANPFALSGRQMEFMVRWIETWSGQVNLTASPLPPTSNSALAVDLAESDGAVIAAQLQPLPTVRYLDFDPLSRTLRQFIAALKQGKTPVQLGLGEDARQPGCENLLMLLYIQWCRAGTERGEERVASEEKAQVCMGLHAAHFFIHGRAFRAPGKSLSGQEERDMQMFGHISERTQLMLASIQSSAVETWRLANRSNTGYMCMLRDPDTRSRIEHYQLLAVRNSTSPVFHVGVAQWLRTRESNQLFVGVRLFPGVPRALTIRPLNFSAPSGVKGYERGLLLPEIPAPSTPATLILPAGWYQPGRMIEIHDGGKQVAKLAALFEKGSDFDRCTLSFAEFLD
jgi:cyclic-di-GMP-binding protein